jgi:hypothetical protein
VYIFQGFLPFCATPRGLAAIPSQAVGNYQSFKNHPAILSDNPAMWGRVFQEAFSSVLFWVT